MELTYSAQEGYMFVGFSLVLLAILFTLIKKRNLGLGRELGISALRAFVQLSILALVLGYVFSSGSLLLVLLIYTFMLSLAAYTSSKRAKGIMAPYTLTLTSISIGAGSTLALLILLQIMPLTPIFLVPLGGMAIGNSMNACSLTLDRLAGEVKANKLHIETLLSLGASGQEALEPYSRQSIRTALIPTLDNLKSLGIIFIPGTMTGMLIGGMDPYWAAMYQLVIIFMILCSNLLTIHIATLLAHKRLFTDAHQLLP